MSSTGFDPLERHGGKNTGGVSFKNGVVEESKVGWARIRFPDVDDLVTQWLPVGFSKTQDDKEYWTLDEGEQVKCLMDDRLEDGVVLCAIYSEVDVPPTDNPEKKGILFKDGGMIEYDRETGVMTLKATTKIILDTPIVEATGLVTAADDVTSGGVSLRYHVHPVTGYITLVPIPAS